MGAIKRRTVRIGTRKSRLALVQTNMVAEAIEAACPEVKCELVPLMTRGDKILKTSLVAFGGKGAFVEEFEQSILNGDIDLAVHSAKDMPMDLSDGLCIGAVLKREDPRDVFVTVKGRTPERSPRIIGTGSPRRQVQIMEHGDVECRLLRGNVDTRLEKLYQGEYDGIILAAAGLSRLGLFEDPRFSFEFLETENFIPAGGQGNKGRSDPHKGLWSAGEFHEACGTSGETGNRGGYSCWKSIPCGSRSWKRRSHHGEGTADIKGSGGPCL